MKFHLPKKLLVAVLAAMCIGTTYAGTMVVPGIVDTINEDKTVDSLPDYLLSIPTTENGNYVIFAPGVTSTKPYVKEGEGQLTIKDVGDETAVITKIPLYVRNGAVELVNCNLIASPTVDGDDSLISVAGHDAELILNGTSYLNRSKEAGDETPDNGAYINVGGPDGSGSLTLKNSSHLSARYSVFVGYRQDDFWYEDVYALNSTSVSSDSTERYTGGIYVPSNGNTAPFGKGVLNIEDGSTVNIGTSFFIGTGELNIKGQGSALKAGVITPTSWSYLGRKVGGITKINIENGGKFITRGYAGTGLAKTITDAIIDIKVDGGGSEFFAEKGLYLGYYADAKTDTTLDVTCGGCVRSELMRFGADNGASIINVTVDDSSCISATADLSIRENAFVMNAGAVSGNNIVLNKGYFALTGGAASLTATGQIDVQNGSTLCIEATTRENPFITTDYLIFDQSENTVELTYSDSFLSGYTSGESFRIYVANVQGTLFAEDKAGLDCAQLTSSHLLWSASDLAWDYSDSTKLYITGTLTKKEVVSFTDEEVELDSSDALVTDKPIVTTGTTSITTAEGVTVILPDEIQNGGDLTMSGSYDGSQLEEITVEDTRVCVDGLEGNNGFYRDGGSAILVVDNTGNATLTVDDGTTVKSKDGESLKLYASGLAAGELDYSNYHIEDSHHEAAMSEIQGMRPDADAALTITMNEGTLVADQDAEDVQATGGTIVTRGDVAIGGNLAGDTSMQVTEGTAVLSGDNSHTGITEIQGDTAVLKVATATALGQSQVNVKSGGTLDLNNLAVSNDVVISGCTLRGAGNYQGNLLVESNDMELDGDASSRAVYMKDGAVITAVNGETLTTNELSVLSGSAKVDADLVINPDGSVVLNDGSKLETSRSLTLGQGVTIVLNGGDYAKGDVLLTSSATTAPASGVAILSYGHGTYVLEGNDIILTAVFDRNIADTLTVSNWGIATASRAFVNAVRGQRTNTGCIADGRGTAWAAVLGGTHDIAGSDIDLKGAAVGADVKVGAASSVGLAVGYIEGDVQPAGLRAVDQEGTYVALYGEHGLKKLSSTSCLSLDWVAAYGNTESEVDGTDWEQDSLQLNTRLNWNKKMTDRLSMSVFGGLEYFAGESDTVDSVKTGSIQNLRGEIGVGARYVAWGTPANEAVLDEKGATIAAARPGCEKLVLHGEVRYMNDMVRSNPVIEQDGLRGDGENPGRQGFGIEAGATYRIGERWSASANYGFNAMDDSREHRVNVGASYTF